MRRLIAVAATAALTAAALVTFAPGAGAGDDLRRGQFATPCGYSHRLPDDPIVKPAQPGASHSHDFIGNVSTDAASTFATLRAAPTMCRRDGDTAAYWAPTLILGRYPVAPLRAQIYYNTGGKIASSIRAFPAGLRVVAGDSTATTAQRPGVTTWGCGPESSVPNGSSVPMCREGESLRLHIRFPDCSNGALDSPDHKAHMAYSSRGACPSSHPTPVPRISFNLVYPLRGGSSVTLASGSPFSGHADFFNAWNQGALESLVRRCINAGQICHAA